MTDDPGNTAPEQKTLKVTTFDLPDMPGIEAMKQAYIESIARLLGVPLSILSPAEYKAQLKGKADEQ